MILTVRQLNETGGCFIWMFTFLFVYLFVCLFVCFSALVFIAHGFGEHSGRYEDFANILVEQDYLVFSHDHGRIVILQQIQFSCSHMCVCVCVCVCVFV